MYKGIFTCVGAGFKPAHPATASQAQRTGAAIIERYWHRNMGGLQTRPYRITNYGLASINIPEFELRNWKCHSDRRNDGCLKLSTSP